SSRPAPSSPGIRATSTRQPRSAGVQEQASRQGRGAPSQACARESDGTWGTTEEHNSAKAKVAVAAVREDRKPGRRQHLLGAVSDYSNTSFTVVQLATLNGQLLS